MYFALTCASDMGTEPSVGRLPIVGEEKVVLASPAKRSAEGSLATPSSKMSRMSISVDDFFLQTPAVMEVEAEAEAVAPPAEEVEPPAEAVAPPAEAVAPPAEAVAPPAEAVEPPAEAVAPPAESMELEESDAENELVRTSVKTIPSLLSSSNKFLSAAFPGAGVPERVGAPCERRP